MIFEHLSSIGLVATRNARSRHAYVVRHLMGRSEGAEGRLKWFTGFGRGTGHPQGVPLRGDLADCRMSAMRGRAPTRGAPTGGFGWLPHVEGCGVGHPQGGPLRGDSAGCRMSRDAGLGTHKGGPYGGIRLVAACRGMRGWAPTRGAPTGGFGWLPHVGGCAGRVGRSGAARPVCGYIGHFQRRGETGGRMGVGLGTFQTERDSW